MSNPDSEALKKAREIRRAVNKEQNRLTKLEKLGLALAITGAVLVFAFVIGLLVVLYGFAGWLISLW